MNGSQKESCCTGTAPDGPQYLSFPFAIKWLEVAAKLLRPYGKDTGRPGVFCCAFVLSH